MPRLLALAALTLALSACGDGGTAPGGAGFAIAGTWNVTVTNAATFARTCTLPPVTLTFTGSNANATGTMSVGGAQLMSCTVSGGGTELNPLPAQLTFSTVNVGSTKVILSTPSSNSSGNDGWTYNGDIGGGNVISGIVAFRVPVNGTYSTTTGDFTATRP